MKTKLLKTIGCIFFALLILSSCKKEPGKHVEPVDQKTQISKDLQTWYVQAVKNQPQNALHYLGNTLPDWNTIVKADKFIITQIKLANALNTYKYFVTELDEKGSFVNGSYYMIVNTGLQKAVNILDILVNELKHQKQAASFNGSVLKYDLAYNKKDGSKYKDGIKQNVDLNIEIKEKQDTGAQAKGVVPNSAISPANCAASGGFLDCEDYYLITYDQITGEIINVEYLYTDCVCVPGTGGGGGNGGGGGTGTCAQQNEEFANMGHAVNGVVTENTILNNGTNWKKRYSWVIFTAGTWGLISYEEGELKKVHYATNNIDLWEFQSFTHLTVLETGVNVGGSRTFSIVTPTINISPIKTSVFMEIPFTVTSTVNCPGVPSLIHPFSASKRFYAPNTILPVL
ncbi:MAG: hypothetical protein WCI49_07045 [Ferruginibacter sp.]